MIGMVLGFMTASYIASGLAFVVSLVVFGILAMLFMIVYAIVMDLRVWVLNHFGESQGSGRLLTMLALSGFLIAAACHAAW
jgi:hypothetical protein